jgi:hypothetical protein
MLLLLLFRQHPHRLCLCTRMQAYQWSRPIPTSLKVIHSRVYAQAITLGALGGMAALETYHRTLHKPSSKEDY